MKKYFVMWAAQRQNGSVAAPVESYEDERSAISAFYLRASQAANGDNIKDTVILVNADGFLLHKACFANAPVQET